MSHLGEGWGGRYKGKVQFNGASDEHWSGTKDRILKEKWTVARFRPAYQNDFRSRLDWCVKPYQKSNHRPELVIKW